MNLSHLKVFDSKRGEAVPYKALEIRHQLQASKILATPSNNERRPLGQCLSDCLSRTEPSKMQTKCY